MALNAAIDIALLGEIGIVAAAIGTDAAMLLYVGGHLWILNRLVDVDFSGLGRTFARTMVAFAVMCGVLFAFGTSDITTPMLLVGGTTAALAYLGALVASGEITPREVAAARAAASRLLPRRPSG